MTQEVGIVLKSFFPYKCKISVLSRHSGQLILEVRKFCAPINFSPGVIIRFTTDIDKIRHIASMIEILYVPLTPIKKHLYWLHYLLEICYYFSPLGVSCIEVFRLLHFSFELGSNYMVFEPYFYKVKKICIVQLLMALGFYPPRSLVCVLDLFDGVVSVFLDSSNVQKVRSLHKLLEKMTRGVNKKIDIWILSCLQEHPQIKQFKALSFYGRI